MDSGYALRFARNDDLINHQANPAKPTPLPPASPNATDRTDHTPDGPSCPEQAPAALGWRRKRTSPQGQQRCRMAGTQLPLSMTNLSGPPNAPPARWQPTRPANPDQTIPCRSNPGAIRARWFSALSRFTDRT